MNSLSYMIGIDIGTTSTKAVLYHTNGVMVDTAHVHYPLYTPQIAAAEQDPDEIFQAVLQTTTQIMTKNGILSSQIVFVSFSAAMHSLIPIDSNGTPLMNALTWADNRSEAYAKQLSLEGGHEIYLSTGTPIHPMAPLSKIMWLKAEYPTIFEQTYKFISIKEYIWAKLFDNYQIDYSIASCTGLMNIHQLSWDETALRTAGITKNQLSEIVPTTYYRNGASPLYTKMMGLGTETTFVIGANDGVLSNLGLNAIHKGEVAVTIGTSGAIRTVVDHPVLDPKGRIFCYALTDKHYVIGGPVNNGGQILRWMKDELGSSEVETAKRLGINPYDLLTQICEKVPPGAEGLLFHPYLAGERAPLWNSNARGSFFGLGLHHHKEHLLRAAMEGVIFNLYTVMLAMEEQIGAPDLIKATGGFASSSLWRQILADIFDQPVVIPSQHESSCLGAVFLGLYALNMIDSFDIVSEMIGQTQQYDPHPDHAAIYKQLLPIFISIPRKLGPEYEAISKFQHQFTLN